MLYNKPKQHWSDEYRCGCGANSNTSHAVSCVNAGLYDEDGNAIEARPRPIYEEQIFETKRKPESPIIRFFDFEHLPPVLASVSMPFYILAKSMDENLPNGPEKSVALRKLLESKDAAVRAALDLI